MRNLIRGLTLALILGTLPLASQAAVFVSVTIAPPALPVYYQPPIPGPGYMWTPGYWAWDDGYYWVPGTWVLAPVGLLWTPGYWGWINGAYIWHGGYWGPHVGFYGGVNYGFGYGGVGFEGGEWRGGHLYYNRSVTNISNTSITNVYNRTVVNNVTVNHTSFNGGPGGVAARPNPAELSAEHERHEAPLQVQTEHRTMAAHNNALRASANGGHPSMAATPRAGVFTGTGSVAARGAGVSNSGGGFRSADRSTDRLGHPGAGAGAPRGYQPQPQPQHAQPRANEPRGNPQREQRPQGEQRQQHDDHVHQARALRAPPQQRLVHAPQSRPQPGERGDHRHG